MQIHLLGTAAGGGVPQWNCHCDVCREARSGGKRVSPRTQSSVALSANGRDWFLLNASPDINRQIEHFPPLRLSVGKKRGSCVQAVLLTNADLDHTLGLLLLREGEKLRVHATANIRHSLTKGISIAPALESFCGVEWIEPPIGPSPLLCRDGSPSGLSYEVVALRGKPPRFLKNKRISSDGYSVGYRITDEKTGGGLLFLPEVDDLNENLLRLLPQCDALLFDGTFWSENEMQERGVGTLSAGEMGHLPISGTNGSLKILAGLGVKHKIYTHINNTNPVLFEDSPERTAIIQAGCVVGRDGMTIEI
jgi:pyrroloquinoline quinone biosynthesis protein B